MVSSFHLTRSARLLLAHQINADERRLRKAKRGVRSRPDAIAVPIGLGHNTVDLLAWDSHPAFGPAFFSFWLARAEAD